VSRGHAVLTSPDIGSIRPDPTHKEPSHQPSDSTFDTKHGECPILVHPRPWPEGQRVELDDLLMLERTEQLLAHCMCILLFQPNCNLLTALYLDDQIICPHQIALPASGLDNPYQTYVLPLAYEQLGLLYAVLGLTACHLGIKQDDIYLRETLAVEYRVRAIRWLGETLRNGISGQLDDNERDGIFVIIQVLLLQDVSWQY
jgi:hypothetical protein